MENGRLRPDACVLRARLGSGGAGWGEVKAKLRGKSAKQMCRDNKGLVSWNRGEAFPSLGIGHFIWFPAVSHGKV